MKSINERKLSKKARESVEFIRNIQADKELMKDIRLISKIRTQLIR